MTCPAISMTWPQHQRSECVIGGELHRLAPRISKLLLLLLLRRGSSTAYSHAIEWMWELSDREPAYAQTIISMCITDLRRRGIPIKTRNSLGFEIVG